MPTNSNKKGIAYRKWSSSDRDFIFSSWLKSFRGCLVNFDMEKHLYFTSFQKFAEEILKVANVLVSYPETDHDLICGYVVYSDGSLWWVYVKEDFRGFGIASDLLEKANVLEFESRLSGLRMSQEGTLFDPSRQLRSKFGIKYNPWKHTV